MTSQAYRADRYYANLEKGILPLPLAHENVSKNSYAVVVGISGYQDPGMTDLHFADKDAEAFANFFTI